MAVLNDQSTSVGAQEDGPELSLSDPLIGYCSERYTRRTGTLCSGRWAVADT